MLDPVLMILISTSNACCNAVHLLHELWSLLGKPWTVDKVECFGFVVADGVRS